MKPYQALIWNEWRQMRGMFQMITSGIIMVWLTLFILNMLRIPDIDIAATAILFVFTSLFTIIGNGVFQREFKIQTEDFLLSLPVSRGEIFWCKYLFNLSLYLVMVALVCSLFTPLTGDHHSAAKFASSMNSILFEFATMFLCLHASAVVSPLIQNCPGGKTGGWAISIGSLALLIGVPAIVALYPCNEFKWMGLSVSTGSLILWFFALTIGYYLWTNHIAFKRNIMRPLFAVGGILVIFSSILFATAYLYSGWDLAAARRDARAAGLEMNVPPAEAGNGTSGIIESLQQYQARVNVINPKLPSLSGRNDCNYSWLASAGEQQLPPEIMQQAADFILGDPCAVKLYTALIKELNKLGCRFGDSALQPENPDTYLTGTAIDKIQNFISDRAYALELRGKNPEMFDLLDILDKLADSVSDEHDGSSRRNLTFWIKFFKLNTARKIGPDTPAEVKYYENLFRELDAMHPEFNGNIGKLSLSIEQANNGSSEAGILKFFYRTADFLLTPRIRENIVIVLRWQTANKQLFEQAVSANFSKIKPHISNLDKQQADLPLFIGVWISTDQIIDCYLKRTRIVAMKLHLGLKIYKAKHGQFPETLAKLAPEILPSIPDDPIDGEPFTYNRIEKGYLLKGKSTQSKDGYSMYYPENWIKRTL